MAYYYVKNTGSSTTSGGTTKQSGAFSGLAATAVYSSIADAITYGAGSGDFVCVSDIHTESPADSVFTGPTSGAVLTVVGVDDSNCDTEALAASAQFTPSDDVLFTNRLAIYSINTFAVDDTAVTPGSTVRIVRSKIQGGAGSFLSACYGDGTLGEVD